MDMVYCVSHIELEIPNLWAAVYLYLVAHSNFSLYVLVVISTV
jgi:hypothetical protein